MENNFRIFAVVVFQFSIGHPNAFIDVIQMLADELQIITMYPYEFIIVYTIKDILTGCFYMSVYML